MLKGERNNWAPMSQITIVKLGGSAITNKSRECIPDIRTIDHSASQLASYPKPLIVLHGGGSFGHPMVTKAQLQRGFRQRSQLRVITETELYLDELTRIIAISLLRRDRPCASLKPMSFITLKNGEVENVFLDSLMGALKIGLTPLIHGDLAFDSVRGVAVISADRIASLLGIKLRAARVLFGCDVDGVFSGDPKNSRRVHLIRVVDRNNAESIARKTQRARFTDATGGISGKVREAIRLARNGRESCIFNLKKNELLRKALAGTAVGTRFYAWRAK